MAINSAACEIVGQRYWNGSWHGYRVNAAYAGTNVERYYPYILKFTVPEFAGVSLSVAFALACNGDANYEGAGASPTLRWALCDSEENYEMYRDTHSEVADSHQMASGTVTIENVATSKLLELTINTSQVKSGVTYYLFLWGHAAPENPEWITISATDYHTVTLNSVAGAVRVKIVGTVSSCMVVVKTGGALKTCMVGIIQNGKFCPGG